jgi:Zn-dependent protease/CBS domain-containing protein
MKWSWSLGRVIGIEVFIHATFVILLVWTAAIHYLRQGTFAAAAWGVVFTLAVFGTVVLHELGHALTARRFGIRTRDITLLPIGGVARLERMPDDPRQELWVAFAGPAVNAAIAAILYAFLALSGGPLTLPAADFYAQGPFLTKLMWVNVTLAAFNLLPAFPMDGGRVVRAILAMRVDHVQATQTAARIGQGMALVLGLFGLFFNVFLLIIALFIWIGAAGELAAVQVRAALGGLPVAAAMMTDFRTLSPDGTLGEAAAQLLAGSQVDFPVTAAGNVVGVLTRADLLRGLTEGGPEGRVGDAMQRQFVIADPSEMLDVALERAQGCACQTVPVVRDGHVVGVVTMDNIGELLMLQAALRPSRRAGRGAPPGSDRTAAPAY